MTPDQFTLMQRAAQNLLDHQAAGRKCDPEGIKWARHVVSQKYTHPAADCAECLPVLCNAECREAA